MIRYEAIARFSMKASQAGHAIRILLTTLDNKTKVHGEALIWLSGMAGGVLGIARSLVELVSDADRAVVKLITIG